MLVKIKLKRKELIFEQISTNALLIHAVTEVFALTRSMVIHATVQIHLQESIVNEVWLLTEYGVIYLITFVLCNNSFKHAGT